MPADEREFESYCFGDDLDWRSPSLPTNLYVELPFWLMVPSGEVVVEHRGAAFEITLLGPWMEVFAAGVTDSRGTVIHHGPQLDEPYVPSGEVAEAIEKHGLAMLSRPCKSVLRLSTLALSSPFGEGRAGEVPRAARERDAYRASLCQAYIPVINVLIQKYRLATYDYFAFEVSPRDVPIWYIRQGDSSHRVVLTPAAEWDMKPITVEMPDVLKGCPGPGTEMEWTSLAEVGAVSLEDASPGEFELLDARALAERGDYSGAVRRTTTAVEVLITAKFEAELERMSDVDVTKLRKRTLNNMPSMIREWRALSGCEIGDELFDEFASTRSMRHRIVHDAHRLTFEDRGVAQRMIDTSRWLYNQIEGRPERARLRDYNLLKSVGRFELAPRFPVELADGVMKVRPITDGPMN